MADQVKALLNAAVRKTALDLVLSDIYIGERYDVYTKPKFNTAAWTYLPPHRIYMGEGLFENARDGLSEDEQTDYAGSLFRHELGHLWFTERDFKKIRAMLKPIKAPFSLFNLIEDARIEHLSRLRTDLKFNWLSFEEPGQENVQRKNAVSEEILAQLEADVRPESIMFRLIQAETSDLSHPAIKGFLDRHDGEVKRMAHIVQGFYLRAIKTPDSLSLQPVLKDWLEQFPESAKQSSSPNSLSEDLSLAEQLANDPDFREAFEAEASQIDMATGESRKSVKGKPGTPESVDVAEDGNGDLLVDDEAAFDRARAARLAKKLERVLVDPARMSPSRMASKALNIKGISLGSDAIYRRKTEMGVRRKKVGLVIDCSGSMGGYPITEGKVLAGALNLLARQGKLEGYVVLSAVEGHKAVWQRYKLPMSDATIDRFGAFGSAEGLEYAISANLKEMQACNSVFVYTDGHICDKPVDKAKLHQRGVFTCGLYCTEGNDPADLLKFFDRCVVRDTVENLLDALLKELRR